MKMFERKHINQLIGAKINFNGTGVIAINRSYNVTSITDNGTGDYTITWDRDFPDAYYSCVGTAQSSVRAPALSIYITGGLAAGSARIYTWHPVSDTTSCDCETVCVIAA